MKSYRVLCPDLTYPTDAQAIATIMERREQVPWHRRGNKTVYHGAVVSDIPAVSVPGLLAKGAIEEVPDAHTK